MVSGVQVGPIAVMQIEDPPRGLEEEMSRAVKTANMFCFHSFFLSLFLRNDPSPLSIDRLLVDSVGWQDVLSVCLSSGRSPKRVE